MSTDYDSRADTLDHIRQVQRNIAACTRNLSVRSDCHDDSKLVEPEKSGFDRMTPRLKASTYGSDEYKTMLAELGVSLAHHYAANSHHPEHIKLFKCCVCNSILREDETWLVNINDDPPRLCGKCCPNSPIYECEAESYIGPEAMTLLDVIEMLCDWKAATMRHANGDIVKSIEHNTVRFNLSPQLAGILRNTVTELGW